MTSPTRSTVQGIQHAHPHAFQAMNALTREGLVVASRRNMVKASLAGFAGLSLPCLMASRAQAISNGISSPRAKSIILLWMTGGPSHIDTWDPKPDRPFNNRGPFGVIKTKLPGVHFCEHLPKQAAMLDKFTIIRSVDAKFSNHEPNTVFQTGNLDAEPRTNREASLYPSIASVVAKHHGTNQASMPPYVGFYRSPSHIASGGYLGQQYDPFRGNLAAKLPIYDLVGTDTGKKSNAEMFQLSKGLDFNRLNDRRNLLKDLDRIRRDIDNSGAMIAADTFQQQAVDLLVGTKARDAFDLTLEPAEVRERYGSHLWCQQALLARRLVESGVAFVTIDLSYHTASGTWDNHGDNIPPYGGISKGLKPLLPLFDHLITTLVGDLEERGRLEDVMVIAMGEFGRTPMMGTQESTDGRDHWPNVMSMALAGGGLRHGQVIGATEKDGGAIKERPVTPGDLAATIYRYFDVPLTTQYVDHRGRPRNVVDQGTPIAELGL
ncbi:MAG: DUF1501 domain-containing protein [Planctomycetota bacterium]|nr:DUF1501 domain-containing protein [Planctomycetota bacterium]